MLVLMTPLWRRGTLAAQGGLEGDPGLLGGGNMHRTARVTIGLLAMMVVLAGCGAARRGDNAPPELAARLQSWEARMRAGSPDWESNSSLQRLGGDRPDVAARYAGAPRQGAGPVGLESRGLRSAHAVGARVQPISWGGPAAAGTEVDPPLALSWSLADFDDPPPEDPAPDAGQWRFAVARSTDDYQRRPPLDTFWGTLKRDVRHMPRDLWRDTKRVYANPVNLVILGVTYGGSLALQETGPDNTVEAHFDGRHHHFKEDWRDAFGAAGNPGTHFALAGLWYLLGQQTADEKTYEVGKTLFSALIINGLTVMVGQAASSDRSPNGEWGTFPSGHTSSSFVTASVMHRAYGHAIGIPLYGLATLVAIERVEDGEHYFSDVVMGGVLGTVIGHAVASGRDPEFFGWKVLPFASPASGATGIAFAKTFP